MKHSLLFVCCIFFCACNNADDNAGNVSTIRFDIDEQSREISFFDIFERVDIDSVGDIGQQSVESCHSSCRI